MDFDSQLNDNRLCVLIIICNDNGNCLGHLAFRDLM